MARHTQDEDEVVLMKVATTNCIEAENGPCKYFENVISYCTAKWFFHQKKEFLYCTIAIKPT